MAAFRRAVDEGFAYLELDVHATADGVAVVHHDRTLDRTTDATGPLAARTAARARPGAGPAARTGASRSRTWHDVLAALPDTRVTVELKSGAAVRPVLDVLARLDAWHRVCLAGYHDPWLRVARRLARAQRRAAVHLDGPHLGRRAAGARLDPAGDGPAAAGGGARRGSATGRLAPAVRGDLAQLPHRFAGVTVVDADVLRVSPRERPRGARVDRRRPGRDGAGCSTRAPTGSSPTAPTCCGTCSAPAAPGRRVAAGDRRPQRPGHPRAGARLGPVGLGLGGLQHRDPHLRVLGVPDRHRRRRPARRGERQQLAGVVDRAGRAGARAAGPGARGAGRRGGPAAARRRGVDGRDRRDDGRAGRGPRRPPLPGARAGAARARVDLLRAGVGVVQRGAAAGLDAGDDGPGLRVRLGHGLLRRDRPAARGVPGVHRRRRAAARAARRYRPRTAGTSGSSRWWPRCGSRCSPCRCWWRCPSRRPPPTAARPPGSPPPTGRCCTTCACSTGPTGTRSGSWAPRRCSATGSRRCSPSARCWR